LSRDLGHTFEHDRSAGERGGAVLRGATENAGDDGVGVAVRQQTKARQARQRFADFTQRVALKFSELFRDRGLTSIMVTPWPA